MTLPFAPESFCAFAAIANAFCGRAFYSDCVEIVIYRLRVMLRALSERGMRPDYCVPLSPKDLPRSTRFFSIFPYVISDIRDTMNSRLQGNADSSSKRDTGYGCLSLAVPMVVMAKVAAFET